MAVRHNLEAMEQAGVTIDRVAAVGGGTKASAWTQAVSDVTGLEQELRAVTVGASYGAAHLAALAVDPLADIDAWNPGVRRVTPRTELAGFFDARYRLYRELYERSADAMHALAAEQRANADRE